MTVQQARDLYGAEMIDQVLARMAADDESHRRFLERLYAEIDDADELELPAGWERYLPAGPPPASP